MHPAQKYPTNDHSLQYETYIILGTKGPPTLGKKLVVKVPSLWRQVQLLPNTSCIDVLVSSFINSIS